MQGIGYGRGLAILFLKAFWFWYTLYTNSTLFWIARENKISCIWHTFRSESCWFFECLAVELVWKTSHILRTKEKPFKKYSMIMKSRLWFHRQIHSRRVWAKEILSGFTSYYFTNFGKEKLKLLSRKQKKKLKKIHSCSSHFYQLPIVHFRSEAVVVDCLRRSGHQIETRDYFQDQE